MSRKHIYLLPIFERLKGGNDTDIKKYGAYELEGPESLNKVSMSNLPFHSIMQKEMKDIYLKIDFQVLMPIITVCTNFKSAFEEVRMGMSVLPSGLIPYGETMARKRKADAQ
ncbi:hypothetical protein EVAR_70448_1 [Eumeta japonica]|uniref:Uncharacterized protein n=1 Tax=Eumeta variegata TaxID=151549 RepID=A0A4C2AC69_EUMVA|nr:hypothetical protein EVAR_70448_1 [Eumeta japonica]